MSPALPPYFDGLILARARGQIGRHAHLGYWDDPPGLGEPCVYSEFEAAQTRLAARALEIAPPRDGQAILDVACGFGGLLAMIDATCSGMDLTGLNIDARQLDLCRGAVAGPSNQLRLVEGDACALPFADAAFDRIFCVEAMFHFASRQTFLLEAARCLKPGGVFVATDILLRRPGEDAPFDLRRIEDIVRRDYGPWPDLWADNDQLHGWAQAAGLARETLLDWTAATLPTYRFVAPSRHAGDHRPVGAGDIFRWMHSAGHLSYPAMRYRRAA